MSRGRANRPVTHSQLNAHPTGMTPATDEKIDVLPLDLEGRGNEFTSLLVTAEVGVHESLAQITGGTVSMRVGTTGAFAHRFTKDLP